MNKKDSQSAIEDIFKKSSFSGTTNCVEVARNRDGIVKVRDTKDQTGPVLVFTHDEWKAFLAGAQKGEFDIA